ncbi:MAG: hypothetical protein ACF8NJ_06875 [Phycisphaerales bacterium JB038]
MDALLLLRRWYWLVASLLQLLCIALAPALIAAWFRETFPWHSPIWHLGVWLWIANIAWTFGVAPYLDSHDDQSPVWPQDPHRHLAVLRQIVWIPAALTCLSILLLLLIFPYIQQHETGRWVWGLSPWMVLLLPLQIGSIWYARRLGDRLETRLRRTVDRRCQCFYCGYSLLGIASARCPECGGTTPQAVPIACEAAADRTLPRGFADGGLTADRT